MARLRRPPNMYVVVLVAAGFFFIATVMFRYNEIPRPRNHADNTVGDVQPQISNTKTAPVILGTIDSSRKYAVYSTTSADDAESLGFNFLLPLTALAWKRIGFDSVVIIVGSADVWNSDPLLYTVLTSVRQLDAVVIFLDVHPANSVMVSQVSRIFAANLLLRAETASRRNRSHDVIDDVYMITSDADLWPISSSIYNIPADVDVLSLNSFCCGTFKHGTQTYQMIPMANVGARLATWRNLTYRNGRWPSDVDELIDYMKTEFGDVAIGEVHKGENVGWYLDQRLISVLVSDWKRQHGRQRVKMVSRRTGVDRIDRSHWKPGESIVNKVDAHLLNDAYLRSEWDKLTPLLTALHGSRSDNLSWSLDYYRTFNRLRNK